MNLFDAHNHLQDEWLAPHRHGIFPELHRLGVRGAVVNGTCESDWPAVAALAAGHRWIIPSYGLHPWFVAERSADWERRLTERLESGGAAVGEIGLDRWKEPYDFDDQQTVFRRQLALAAERDLPVTIHCLRAWGKLREILESAPLPRRGFLIHAYGGPAEMVGPFAELGAHFSFNGYFLHERKQAQREVFRSLPADRLLVETDAPAMPLPSAWQTHALPASPDGQPVNHPANLAATYRALAELRGSTVDALAEAVEANFHRLFGPAHR